MADLKAYQKKRRFDKTAEPTGQVKKRTSQKLIFVVQKHQATRLHYDFRLELDGVLKSWAVPKGPSLNPADKHLAMMVEDHPFDYRNFEGDIAPGNYGAGQVIVWDRGTYEPAEAAKDNQKTLRADLEKGHLKINLHGQKLNGIFNLIKTPKAGDNAWLLIKDKDKYSTTEDITADGRSVIGDLSLSDDEASSEGPKSDMPTRLKPMLASLAEGPFDDEHYLFEVKWDGYRAIGSYSGHDVQLYSRNGLDFSQRYKPISEALRRLSRPAVLDGEIVMVDETGRSHFELLQDYQKGANGQLIYYAFDLIWLDGHDVTDLPLVKRKELLRRLLGSSEVIKYSDHVIGKGRDFFKLAVSQQLEGIMAKAGDSRYIEGLRSKRWLKIKVHLRQEFVIGGFTEPKGSRQGLGALLLGVYQDNKLIYVGHSGSGIPTDQLKPLRNKLLGLERSTSPFANEVKPNAPVHFTEPKLVCEVSFSEWTKDRRLRQPIFKGLRNDKRPTDIIIEKPVTSDNNSQHESAAMSESRIKFSHLDKVFWPDNGYTKGDLLKYYERISETMLPYLIKRPHNLFRQPNGVKGPGFFQKDVSELQTDWIKTVKVYSESNQKKIAYFVCDGLDALLYMVQLGCIEINPWSSTVDRLDHPNWAVIDLDPEGVDFKAVVKVSLEVKAVCDELKIPTYPKTSGKTGLHIFIPTGAKYTYAQVRQFGELIANLVYERTSKITSVTRDPKKRQHKIYLDYLQNRESQTLAAPYSVRPSKEASVSTPLDWSEVNNRLNPAKFTIKTFPKRLAKEGDLWSPVLGKGVDLMKIISQLD